MLSPLIWLVFDPVLGFPSISCGWKPFCKHVTRFNKSIRFQFRSKHKYMFSTIFFSKLLSTDIFNDKMLLFIVLFTRVRGLCRCFIYRLVHTFWITWLEYVTFCVGSLTQNKEGIKDGGERERKHWTGLNEWLFAASLSRDRTSRPMKSWDRFIN